MWAAAIKHLSFFSFSLYVAKVVFINSSSGFENIFLKHFLLFFPPIHQHWFKRWQRICELGSTANQGWFETYPQLSPIIFKSSFQFLTFAVVLVHVFPFFCFLLKFDPELQNHPESHSRANFPWSRCFPLSLSSFSRCHYQLNIRCNRTHQQKITTNLTNQLFLPVFPDCIPKGLVLFNCCMLTFKYDFLSLWRFINSAWKREPVTNQSKEGCRLQKNKCSVSIILHFQHFCCSLRMFQVDLFLKNNHVTISSPCILWKTAVWLHHTEKKKSCLLHLGECWQSVLFTLALRCQ